MDKMEDTYTQGNKSLYTLAIRCLGVGEISFCHITQPSIIIYVFGFLKNGTQNADFDTVK